LGVQNKSSKCAQVRELLAHLVDLKYRWDAFLPPVLAANEDEEETDEDVKLKRSPTRFRLQRLEFDDGQEVVDFIRVLGKKPHRFSQFHSLYKKSDSDRESPYLEVIAYLDLPVHSPQFIKENADYITAHHEAGHIVASHLLSHSPAEAVGAKIRRFASYTTFRPKDINAMDNTEESFLDKHATAMGESFKWEACVMSYEQQYGAVHDCFCFASLAEMATGSLTFLWSAFSLIACGHLSCVSLSL
jgi:hypothetical protein